MLSRRRAGAAAVAVGLLPVLGACGHRAQATLRTDVTGQTAPAVVSTDLPVSQKYTLQAGGLCSEHGRVTITSIEPLMRTGRLLVTDWGTRDPHSLDAIGDQDPAGARRSLRSLHGFTRDPVDVPCSRPASSWRELDIEMQAATPLAAATGFRLRYGHGRSVVVHLGYGRCSPQITRAGRCPHRP